MKKPYAALDGKAPFRLLLLRISWILSFLCLGIGGSPISVQATSGDLKPYFIATVTDGQSISKTGSSGKDAQKNPSSKTATELTKEEAKAKAEAETKAKEEAEARAKEEAEAVATRLRQEAEEAQQNAEMAFNDALWDEAFKQNQAELNSIEIRINGFSGQLRAIIEPLRKALPGMEESARQLFTLSGTHKLDPIMLEVLDRRGMLLTTRIQQQMQPLLSAQAEIADMESALGQMKKSFPTAPESKGGRSSGSRMSGLDAEQVDTLKKINKADGKRERMAQVLEHELTPATELLQQLNKMHTDIVAYLPSLWQRYYLDVPSRFFDPVAWQGITERWSRAQQNILLRWSMELPGTSLGWQAMGLRFLNVLVLGCAILFFANKRMLRSEQKGSLPPAARFGILRSVLWIWIGLALLGAAFSSQGEQFRVIMILGSLFVISGEMAFAWGLRCLVLGKKMGITPLWPLGVSSTVGILLSYPDLPGGILSLSWILAGLFSLGMLRFRAQENVPFETHLLHIHRLAIWISLGIAVIGWSRTGILILVLVDCLLISSQLVFGLVQLLNRTSETQENSPTEQSVLGGLVAACIAPIVLLLVIGGMLLWVVAMPGGAPLLWHYLGTGVQVGSASFNMVHLILVISVFYITRAAIAASRRLLNRLSTRSYRIDNTLIPPLQTGITYGLWTLFGLFTLKALGFGLENLAVIAGGLSVGIGFGMQTIVNNFLSGLILIFSRTLHEGDVVDVGSLQGTVRKISVRATTVETYDNALIFVPNSEFVSNRLINWTRNGRNVRREVSIGVAYGTDPKQVEKLLLGVAEANPLVARHPAPLVLFMDFGDSTLNFVLRYWSDVYASANAASAMRHEINRVFAEHGVEIAFPQLDVHMIPASLPSPLSSSEQVS